MEMPELRNKPPVIVDIGASGSLSREWEDIAGHCICIAFDADDREMGYIVDEKSKYNKLYIFNKIVSDKIDTQKFYLTKSPFCSSTLEPDQEQLKNWIFSDLFQVGEVIEYKTVDLPSVLSKLSIDYIDWFKTDSQGTDLRIFKSLSEEIISKIIVAEFEPGINDAYLGEDKMHAIMSFMEQMPFWLAKLRVEEIQRISLDTLNKEFTNFDKKLYRDYGERASFWGEMTYINNFINEKMQGKRNLLLGWIFSTIKKHYGFSLEIALMGIDRYKDPIFQDLREISTDMIKKYKYIYPFLILGRLFNRINNKLIRIIENLV